MKRQKSKRKPATKRRRSKTPNPESSKPENPGRRDFLGLARRWGLVALVAAGGGWYLVDEVTATIAEQDLSKIGNGIPTVVQIHDPQCPRCIELQRESRKAMKSFDDDKLQYLVANIRSTSGRALATKHGVGHVTLLLLDGKGKRRDTLHGNHPHTYLENAFKAHASRFARPSS